MWRREAVAVVRPQSYPPAPKDHECTGHLPCFIVGKAVRSEALRTLSRLYQGIDTKQNRSYCIPLATYPSAQIRHIEPS